MKKTKENYLEKVAIINSEIGWNIDDKGIVTLNKKNKGIANKLLQIVLKKHEVSYIHLDEFGSFVWKNIDGNKDISEIGEAVKIHFGEKAEPLYERLAKYFQILSSYGFIEYRNK